jgi:hypothetical protein
VKTGLLRRAGPGGGPRLKRCAEEAIQITAQPNTLIKTTT